MKELPEGIHGDSKGFDYIFVDMRSSGVSDSAVVLSDSSRCGGLLQSGQGHHG